MTKYILLLIFLSGNVFASGSYHHNDTTIINTQPSNGTALATAIGSLNFDWASKKPQVSIGVGSYKGSEALSVGIAKRYGRVLISGSVASEGSSTGYGGSITFHF